MERPANSQQRSWVLCFDPSKCASEAGETLKVRLIFTGENVRGFYFSPSLFPYQCYPSQSRSKRKHIPSFHLHMSSTPTGEKEALFPKPTYLPYPQKTMLFELQREQTSNNNIPPCLQNLFKKKLHINMIPMWYLIILRSNVSYHPLSSFLTTCSMSMGLVPNNSTHIR